MRKRHTRKFGIIYNLITGGIIIATGVIGILSFVESAKAGKTQKQYEALVQTVSRETEAENTVDGRRKETDEEEMPYESPIDFEMLSSMNPDIAGWIRIPDTRINYPIVQGRDNDTYLYKSFSGEDADAGCIFLDFESRRDLRGYNNILYGHNMKDGSMFRDVVRYKDEDYFKEHQYFEIYTPEETIHLKAVACYYIQDDPEVRRTRFREDQEFSAFVRNMLAPCKFAQIPLKPVANLYTLVTCSYEAENGKTVLFAVEQDQESKTP